MKATAMIPIMDFFVAARGIGIFSQLKIKSLFDASFHSPIS